MTVLWRFGDAKKNSVLSDFYCLPNELALIGRSPFRRYCQGSKKTAAKARIDARGVKAFEKSVFGPCTLRRTWGTRPEPTTVVVSRNPARSCRPKFSRPFWMSLPQLVVGEFERGSGLRMAWVYADGAKPHYCSLTVTFCAGSTNTPEDQRSPAPTRARSLLGDQ
jgi:hypothetical protein